MTQERLTDEQLKKLPALERRKQGIRRNNQDRADGIRKNITAREQRMVKGLIRGLKDLAEPERKPPTLSRLEPRGAIPAARGYSEVNQQPGTGGTGGGLASPLTEGATAGPEDPTASVLDRTYYPATSVTSSDGLFVWEITPVETIKFRDANGDTAEFKLGNPYAEIP